jgi:prolyl-tRNA synthetase
MTEENKKVDKKITPRNEDYSQWYLDIIDVAELAENSSVRGCMIIKPYGYSLWENTQKVLDKRFKELGVKNAYFPIFIPEKLIKKKGNMLKDLLQKSLQLLMLVERN